MMVTRATIRAMPGVLERLPTAHWPAASPIGTVA
jgi:hypothetical protein